MGTQTLALGLVQELTFTATDTRTGIFLDIIGEGTNGEAISMEFVDMLLIPGPYDYGRLAYRYGFNGKENDREWGTGRLTQDYGFRLYNPAIAKFLSVDPLSYKYAELTPYQFASNRPIDGVDLDGLEYVGSTTIEGGDPPLAAQTFYAIPDFIANTFSAGMNLFNQSAEGRVIRKVLEKNGYDVSYITNGELGEKFNLKMITGGTASNSQRGLTVLPTQSTISEITDYFLGGLSAVAVVGAFKGGKDAAALLASSGSTSLKAIQNILRGLYINKRVDELKKLGNDAATGSTRNIELEDAADLEFLLGGTLAPSPTRAYDFIGTGGALLGDKISHMGIPTSAIGKYELNDILTQIDKHFTSGSGLVNRYIFNFSNLTDVDKTKAIQRTQDKAKEFGIDANRVVIKY